MSFRYFFLRCRAPPIFTPLYSSAASDVYKRQVAEIGRMYLRAYITSEQLSQVKLGDKVTVYSDYGNSEQKAYTGVITWISERSEFTPKTILTKNERANLVYAVKIAVENDGALKIGMYGGVKF